MAKPLGYILDEFNSPIDGAPCVAILTLRSNNNKTGDMAQVWIIRSDINPVEAVNAGDDYSICGNCPHRKGENSYVDGVLTFTDKQNRSCYVNTGQAPNSVYKAYKAGRYARDPMCLESRKAVKGRKIRFGAYGDPAIIRPVIVETLIKAAAGHTGYTHQWRQSFADAFKGLFMASVDGAIDYIDASIAGWKTFSVVPKGYKPNNIKLCPATVNNSKAQCFTCSLCDGAKTSIYVEAHGSGAKYVTSMT
jgi:hypothetical protein